MNALASTQIMPLREVLSLKGGQMRRRPADIMLGVNAELKTFRNPFTGHCHRLNTMENQALGMRYLNTWKLFNQLKQLFPTAVY